LKRAGNRCENCQAPHLHIVKRRALGTWLEEIPVFGEGIKRRWRDRDGHILLRPPPAVPTRKVRIVITVGHLNHTPGDDRDENLRAMCQWCHLAHDRQQHTKNAHETRATRKDAARPLLAELAATP
jgi:hypothetical protein